MTAPAFQLGAAIPAELRERKNWVVWRLEPRDGRITKIPYSAVGKLAKTTDASTWLSYPEAVALAARGFSGVGYVFAADDPYTGVDFDSCRDPATNAWDPDVLKEIAALDSYTEVSQSGNGLHVIVRASLAGLTGNRRGKLELYDRGRYFALTGDLFQGRDMIQERQAAVNELHAWHIAPIAPAPTAPSIDPGTVDLAGDVADILERIEAHPPKDWHRLYIAGETRPGKSGSEADKDLACLFAQYTRDPAVIVELMKGSALPRAKWQKNRNYLTRTIAYALRTTPERSADAPGIAAARSLAEIRQHPDLLIPPEVVVPGLAWKGRITLVAAREGLGKSTLFAEAANAVTTGQSFLGSEPTVNGSVLWVLSEEHLADVNARALALDPTKQGETQLFILDRPSDPLGELEAEVTRLSPRLLIVDTVHSFAGALIEHASQGDDWRPVMGTLDRIARAPKGPAILMSAEANKATGDYKDSTAIGHGVDVSFTLKSFKNDEVTRELVIKKARWPVAKTSYQMQVGRLVQIACGSGDEAKSADDPVLRALSGDLRTPAELAPALGVKPRAAKQQLEARFKAGKCRREGGGGKGDPHRYARLPRPEDLSPSGERF